MDIIIDNRKILHGSGRVPEGWLDLPLSILDLQKSLIFKFLCSLWDKSNGRIKITYEHHPLNQEDPQWIRKGSWKMSRSNFKVKRSVNYQFVCTLQDKFNGVVKITYRFSLDQKGFLKDDQIYFCEFWSNKKVWYNNLYLPCDY